MDWGEEADWLPGAPDLGPAEICDVRPGDVKLWTEDMIFEAVEEMCDNWHDTEGKALVNIQVEFGQQRPLKTIMQFMGDDLINALPILNILRVMLRKALYDVCRAALISVRPGPWSRSKKIEHALATYIWRFANWGPDDIVRFNPRKRYRDRD